MADRKAPKMKLYWYPGYRSVRNIWLIREMGVEDDFEFIKYKPGEDPVADAAYRKDVHPHVTVPALVVPGRPPLLESGSICLYLADKYGKLVPDPKDRADYYDFFVYGLITMDEITTFYYFYWIVKSEKDHEKEKKMRVKMKVALDYLTQRLADRDYICGNTFTAADCAIGYSMNSAAEFKEGELLKDHPKVQEYAKRLQSRPAFQATVSMH